MLCCGVVERERQDRKREVGGGERERGERGEKRRKQRGNERLKGGGENTLIRKSLHELLTCMSLSRAELS